VTSSAEAHRKIGEAEMRVTLPDALRREPIIDQAKEGGEEGDTIHATTAATT
jgi:hypothetical protein